MVAVPIFAPLLMSQSWTPNQISQSTNIVSAMSVRRSIVQPRPPSKQAERPGQYTKASLQPLVGLPVGLDVTNGTTAPSLFSNTSSPARTATGIGEGVGWGGKVDGRVGGFLWTGCTIGAKSRLGTTNGVALLTTVDVVGTATGAVLGGAGRGGNVTTAFAETGAVTGVAVTVGTGNGATEAGITGRGGNVTEEFTEAGAVNESVASTVGGLGGKVVTDGVERAAVGAAAVSEHK
jgi:hypothetical protein